MFSPHDSNVLYAAGNKVFRTTDEGHSWETISPDLTYADPDTMGVSGPLTMDTAGAEMYATIFSLMVSAHQQGVLMTGSDDGLVHLSTNDGGDWANVTPPDLPKFSQVTMIAESPHTPGTIYMTAARHKTGDYAPYVFKTDDLGTHLDADRRGAAAARVLPRHPRGPEPPRSALRRAPSSASMCRSTTAPAGSRCSATFPSRPSTTSSSRTPTSSWRRTGVRSGSSTTSRRCTRCTTSCSTASRYLLKPRDVVRNPPHIAAAWAGTSGGKNYHVTSGQNATFYVEELETGHVRKRVIDAGEDLERGVRIMYFLDEAAVGEAQPDHQRRRRQRDRDVLEHDPRGEEGSRRAVVHHRSRGHEHLPMADDVPRTA